MNWLCNAKMRTKLLFMISMSIISLVVVSLMGQYYLNASNGKIQDLYNNDLLPIKYLEEAKSDLNASNTVLFELMVNIDEQRNDTLKKSLSDHISSLNKSLDSYKNTSLDSFESNKLKELSDNLSTADKLRNDVVALAMNNKNSEAYDMYNKKMLSTNENIEKNISDLVDYTIKLAEKSKNDNWANFTKVKFITITVQAIFIMLIILVSLYIVKLITRPIKAFEEYTGKISDGDLSEESISDVKSIQMCDDEIGRLGHSILRMRKKLWILLYKVTEITEEVSSSSEELSANSEESAKAMEETAKSVSEIAGSGDKLLNKVTDTSATLSKISESIIQVAGNSAYAADVATQTLKANDDGEKAINETKEQMNNIERTVIGIDSVVKKLGEKSTEIGQIVETIASIASQTNLLALNAAIEAARAGESGKGFAVVAEEVRKLAEESQEATEKISRLISEIQNDTNSTVYAMKEGINQVGIGMNVVEKAKQSFGDISELIHKITAQIQEISAASQSIAEGSERIVNSMEDVDNITKGVSTQSQIIAASTEEQTASIHEIANASESLAKIGEDLISEVSKFKL